MGILRVIKYVQLPSKFIFLDISDLSYQIAYNILSTYQLSRVLFLNAIKVKTLSQEIAEHLKEMIRKGTFKKGDRLVEKRLCELLGVGRTPIREALQVLGADGLVALVPNKGAVVTEPSMQEIREMFWVMSILEGMSARVCAQTIDENGLKKLETLHQKLEKYFVENNHEKYMATNHKYHTLVQDFAGSKILSEVIDGLRQKILFYRYRQIYQPNRLGDSIQEHRDLHDAIKRRDPEAAERLMKEHLMKQSAALEGVYA